MEKKSVAQEIREFADKLAQINPEVQEAEHDREYYRKQDLGQLNHAKSMLMKTAEQLEVAIDLRSKFSGELMGMGNKAGTGDLYNLLDKLNELIEDWDNQTELYGM
tara:strand:+ start:503 stop:820 length:318 start_codon:yes stop_codon:yes gene_type:complete